MSERIKINGRALNDEENARHRGVVNAVIMGAIADADHRKGSDPSPAYYAARAFQLAEAVVLEYRARVTASNPPPLSRKAGATFVVVSAEEIVNVWMRDQRVSNATTNKIVAYMRTVTEHVTVDLIAAGAGVTPDAVRDAIDAGILIEDPRPQYMRDPDGATTSAPRATHALKSWSDVAIVAAWPDAKRRDFIAEHDHLGPT